MRGLPLAAWIYISAVAGLAVMLIAWPTSQDLDLVKVAVLALLFLVCESVPALLNISNARMSMSFAAALASVVLLGPLGAAIVGAVAVLNVQRGLGPVKRVFNGAMFAVTGYIAGSVYTALLPIQPGVPDRRSFDVIIGPFIAAVATHVVVNLILIGGILALTAGVSIRGVRLRPVGQLAVGYLGYGMFGLLIAGVWGAVGPFSAVLVLLPLFVARWALAQTRAQQQAHDATIATLCQAVETKDYYTRGHSERVSRGSVLIAQKIGMRPERVEAIRYAGMLHDVGKLGVPSKVLQKSGPLTEEEFAAIQLHPMRGLEIVRDIGFLDEALAGIMHHHERIDGRGYPMGLAGDEIPEFARVISVADAFDSMTSNRSYRGARSVSEAIAELHRGSGSQFDPVFVEAFVEALSREGWQLADSVGPPDDDIAETTQQDHDDPSTPIKVVGERARW